MTAQVRHQPTARTGGKFSEKRKLQASCVCHCCAWHVAQATVGVQMGVASIHPQTHTHARTPSIQRAAAVAVAVAGLKGFFVYQAAHVNVDGELALAVLCMRVSSLTW